MLQKDDDLQIHYIIKEKVLKLVGVKCGFFFFLLFPLRGLKLPGRWKRQENL